jgi:HAD superfamily hydrolase (TIGR01490 family)
MLVLSPMLLRYALRLMPNWRAKEAMLRHFFANWSEERLYKVGQRFAVQVIPQLLRPEALQRVRWHQEQGHQLVVLSASLEAYLLPWGEKMGFDQVISTRLEVKSGIVSGRILGKNCYGIEKVERLKAYLGDLSGYCLYAYGDSLGDRELLNSANYPYYRTFDRVSPF